MRIVVDERREADDVNPHFCFTIGSAAPLPLHFQAEHHILLDGEPREQRVSLKHHAPVRARAGDRLAVEQQFAAGVLLQPGKDADQRAFPAPGLADDRHKFASVDAEVDIAKRFDLALGAVENLAEVIGLQHDRARVQLGEAGGHLGRLFTIVREISRQHCSPRRAGSHFQNHCESGSPAAGE